MKTMAFCLFFGILLAACVKKTLPEGDVKGIVKFYNDGGITNLAGNSGVDGAAFDRGTGNINAWWPATNGGFATIYRIATSGSTVYVGGSFSNAGGAGRNNIAALNNTNGTALSWNPNADQQLKAIAVSGSSVYAGGTFATVNGKTRSYLAVIDSSTGEPY